MAEEHPAVCGVEKPTAGAGGEGRDRDQEPSDEQVRAFLSGLGGLGGLGRGAAGPEANLIGVLQEVQDRFGYLPPAALEEISRLTRTPLSRLWGVVSFYAQFYTEPKGKHMIRCCRGTACHVRGGKGIIQAVRKALGIEDGETTEDMLFSFETVACLGACALSPVMVVDGTYYGKATPRRTEEILHRIMAPETVGQGDP